MSTNNVGPVPQWRESAYNAVRQNLHLTDDAWMNARIWRAVESALNDVAISIKRGPDYLNGTKPDPANALIVRPPDQN